jgi:RNA polymerase sigma factor (sigma-70 family)
MAIDGRRGETPAPAGHGDDGALYTRAVAGDRSAVEALVTRYNDDLTRYVKAKTTATALADDAVAEAWLRFFRHLREAADNPDRALDKPDSIRFWLYRTALNTLRDQFRSSTRQVDLADRATGEAVAMGRTAHHPDELAALEDDERRSMVRDAFAKLGDGCRELLALLTVDPPLPYSEIAELVDRPVGSLGPTRQRCLKELRLKLGVVQ